MYSLHAGPRLVQHRKGYLFHFLLGASQSLGDGERENCAYYSSLLRRIAANDFRSNEVPFSTILGEHTKSVGLGGSANRPTGGAIGSSVAGGSDANFVRVSGRNGGRWMSPWPMWLRLRQFGTGSVGWVSALSPMRPSTQYPGLADCAFAGEQ
jgi:hypothetical protein